MKTIIINICFFLLLLISYSSNAAQRQFHTIYSTLLNALEDKPLVAIGENPHESEVLYDFYLDFLRSPETIGKVNDIVFEVANSRHQDLLDDFILNGKELSSEQISVVWRDATNSAEQVGDSKLYLNFFKTVQSINRRLPQKYRYRVIAADPPVHWEKIDSQSKMQKFISQRTDHQISVIEREVLNKSRKAVIIIGSGHLWKHANGDKVSLASHFATPLKLITTFQLLPPDLIKGVRTDFDHPQAIHTSDNALKGAYFQVGKKNYLLEQEFDVLLYIKDGLVQQVPEEYPLSHPYYKEHIRRKNIVATNPFRQNKSGKSRLKAYLFDIAQQSSKLLSGKLNDAVIDELSERIEHLNKEKRDLSVKMERPDAKDEQIRLIGTLWSSDKKLTPKMRIHVNANAKDFAMVRVERF